MLKSLSCVLVIFSKCLRIAVLICLFSRRGISIQADWCVMCHRYAADICSEKHSWIGHFKVQSALYCFQPKRPCWRSSTNQLLFSTGHETCCTTETPLCCVQSVADTDWLQSKSQMMSLYCLCSQKENKWWSLASQMFLLRVSSLEF